MIDLKTSYFPLIHLPSWLSDSLLSDSSITQLYIQSCSLNHSISISERHETIYAFFVSILKQSFLFFHNLATLLFLSSWKLQFLRLIDNKTSCRPIRSVIILVINKSDSRSAVVRFCYHLYDYRPNWTPLSPITITYQWISRFFCYILDNIIFNINQTRKLII